MFTEVTYDVRGDAQRLEMYEDWEKRARSGQKMIGMYPSTFGEPFFDQSRTNIQTLSVVFLNEAPQS